MLLQEFGSLEPVSADVTDMVGLLLSEGPTTRMPASVRDVIGQSFLGAKPQLAVEARSYLIPPIFNTCIQSVSKRCTSYYEKKILTLCSLVYKENVGQAQTPIKRLLSKGPSMYPTWILAVLDWIQAELLLLVRRSIRNKQFGAGPNRSCHYVIYATSQLKRSQVVAVHVVSSVDE